MDFDEKALAVHHWDGSIPIVGCGMCALIAQALRDVARETGRRDYKIAYAYARDWSDNAALMAEKIGDEIKDLTEEVMPTDRERKTISSRPECVSAITPGQSDRAVASGEVQHEWITPPGVESRIIVKPPIVEGVFVDPDEGVESGSGHSHGECSGPLPGGKDITVVQTGEKTVFVQSDRVAGSGHFTTTGPPSSQTIASGHVWRQYAQSDAGKLEYAQHEIATLKEEIERLKGSGHECAARKALELIDWACRETPLEGQHYTGAIFQIVTEALTQPCPSGSEDTRLLEGLMKLIVVDPGTAQSVYIRQPMNGHGYRFVTHDDEGYPATIGEGTELRDCVRAAIESGKSK